MKPIKMAGPWITDLERSTVAEMMESGWDDYGYVEKFESAFADWHGRKYCLMTPCCTHAIHLLLLSLGIGEGDEVIVPECTWTASAAPITYVNATPVFADICPETWCVDPESVRENLTEKTRAIIVVDIYGNMPDMPALEKLAAEHNLFLIEDAAEALGSRYKDGRAGKFGVGGVHSFHRTKTLTTGEGGALLIDDDQVFDRASFLRDHGRSKEKAYFTLEAAPKYMPSNIQGSLAWAQFQRLDELIQRKRYLFKRYKQNLSDIEDIQFNIDDDDLYNGVWATTVVFGESHHMGSSEVIKRLANLDVPARPFFYPLSSLPAYINYRKPRSKNNTDAYDVSSRGITLPCHFELTDAQIDFISEKLRSVLSDRR